MRILSDLFRNHIVGFLMRLSFSFLTDTVLVDPSGPNFKHTQLLILYEETFSVSTQHNATVMITNKRFCHLISDVEYTVLCKRYPDHTGHAENVGGCLKERATPTAHLAQSAQDDQGLSTHSSL